MPPHILHVFEERDIVVLLTLLVHCVDNLKTLNVLVVLNHYPSLELTSIFYTVMHVMVVEVVDMEGGHVEVFSKIKNLIPSRKVLYLHC